MFRRGVVIASSARTECSNAALRKLRLSLLTAACAILPAAVQAQGVQLEAISVTGDKDASIENYVPKTSATATKTNTLLIETPQAVSVVGAEQIRDQQPQKFDEVGRYSPGVKGEIFGPDTHNDWFLIRGFRSDNDGIFLDGLQLYYTAYGSFKLQPFGLERVDIVRGPSSGLFGSGSPGGILNAVSKRPTVEPLRYLEVGVNNFGNRYVNFDLGGPLAVSRDNGQFFYRLTGQARAGDTQTNFVQDDNYFIAPAVTWIPNMDTKLTILSMASHNESKGVGFIPYLGTVVAAPFGRIGTDVFVGEPGSDTFRRDQLMIGYQLEHSISNNVTFRQNARYAHVDVNFSTYIGAGYVGDPADGNLARDAYVVRSKASQANLDNQLEFKFGTGPIQHTALVGIDLKHYAIDDMSAYGPGAGGAINVINPVYGQLPAYAGAPGTNAWRTLDHASLYAQDQIKFNRFTLVVTGRHDELRSSNEDRITSADQSRTDGKTTGRVGLIYTSDIGLAPYVSYATSFAPVIGVNGTTNALFFPESARQTEVGVKYSPTWMNGYFGVALFDLTRQNIQSTSFAPFIQTQIGEINSQGFELEAVLNPAPGLKLMGAYTAYDFVTTADIVAANVGKTLPATPEQFGSLWADYTFQTGSLRGFGFGGGVRYVGRSYADTLNTLIVPAATVGDATIHYERDGWRYALNVVNFTDKTYVASCNSPTYCYYAERLRATASVSYKW